jgi:hypothetical protein
LKRVFNLDLEHCPNCGGELKLIGAILERPAIQKILKHLGLEARAPPRAPARGQIESLSPRSKSSKKRSMKVAVKPYWQSFQRRSYPL